MSQPRQPELTIVNGPRDLREYTSGRAVVVGKTYDVHVGDDTAEDITVSYRNYNVKRVVSNGDRRTVAKASLGELTVEYVLRPPLDMQSQPDMAFKLAEAVMTAAAVIDGSVSYEEQPE